MSACRPSFRPAALACAALGLSAAHAAYTAADFSPPHADVVRHELERAPRERHCALYLQLSEAVEDDDMVAARAAARQAQDLAQTPRDRLQADLRWAWVVRRGGDVRQALDLARAGERQAQALSDSDAYADFVCLEGYALGTLSEFPSAVAMLQKAVALAEALPDLPLRAKVHQIFGVVYDDIPGSDKPELAEFEASARISGPFGPSLLYAWTIADIANVQNELGNYPAAEAGYDRALAMIREVGGSRRMIADQQINLGLMYVAEGQPTKGIPGLREAVAIHSQLGLKRNLSNAYKALAIALRESGQLAESLRQFELGLKVAESLRTPGMLMRYYTEIALLHEKMGDWRRVAEYERKAAAEREASANESTRLRLEELRAKYDADERERDLKILRQSEALEKVQLRDALWVRLSLLGGLLFVGAATGVVIGRQRLLLRTNNRILEETEAARRAAENADRLKTRFLGIASHDIKGPLAAVIHLAGEMREEFAGQGRIDDRFDLLIAEVRRVLRHARDFLDIAALETGRLELSVEPVDLAALTREVIHEHGWHADAKRQRIVLEAPAQPLGPIEADGARLHQVLSNLIDNACKYSPSGTVVTVSLGRTPEHVCVSVRDQGPGLSLEDASRLFLPFTRLGPKPTDGELSHGYGLSIAQEIARLHGGRIFADSRPGKGATFTLELPGPAEATSPPSLSPIEAT